MKLKYKVFFKYFLIIIFFSNPIISLLAIEKKEDIKNTLVKELDISKNEYLLGPGDIIKIMFLYGETKENFSGKYKILNDGSVSLPLVGSVNLENLTLKQASEKVENLYSNELLRPELDLTISNPRPIKVSVIGEVISPGIYSLSSEEIIQTEGGPQIRNFGTPTLIDALQKSGGITQNANLFKVILIRKMSGKEGDLKKTTIDLHQFLMDGNQIRNPYLFDGDIIKLTKASKIPKNIIEISKTNFSPQTIKVSVIGQVNNPGLIEVDANTPLIQSILIAGGAKNWKSNKGNVKLIRVNRDGRASFKKYKINLRSNVSSKSNPPLKNGDIVKVENSLLGNVSEGLSALTEPISPIVTSLTLIKLLQ